MPRVGQMNGNRYRILGYVVWRGAKWYLRRRLPSRRELALGGLAAAVTLTGAAVAARRLSS
jgi:hypothetical protein